MVFSSPVFLFLFLPALLLLYFIAPNRLRNFILLIFSLLFYSWGEGAYILLMGVSIIANYGFGLLLANDNSKKAWLFLGVGVNLLLLIYFKYFNFIVQDIFNQPMAEEDKVHLPIGISFFTFQSISYLVDVYKERTKAQRNIFNLALFISLFPQLIAGPIIRYHDIASQIGQRIINSQKVVEGAKRFIFGLAKKVIIADTFGRMAEQLFSLPVEELSFGVSWLAALSFTIQIYFDFSGYSDMAIGLGRIFGFKFLENFNYPYISASVQEFWRRWHISLSNWFRDYLYIPLGGNQKGNFRTYLHLIIVFVLCGFWHGASWNFLVWGIYHGSFLILERLVPVKVKVIGHVYTLLVVIIGWVFFNAPDLPYALEMIQSMFGMSAYDGVNVMTYFNNEVGVLFVLAILFSTPIYKRIYTKLSEKKAFQLSNSIVSVILLLITISYMSAETYSPFLYYRF